MHNITFNSLTNKWEVMTRGAAWHNLGQVVQGAQTWEQTRELAGLTWNPVKKQLDFNGVPVPAYGIFRDDFLYVDAEKAFICPATDTYEVLDNEMIFTYLDAVVESDGAHYESAGSLNNGAQVWALVNLHEAFEIGASGDRFESFLCFNEDRTGQRAARVFLTTVRVVCANTLNQAYGQTTGKGAKPYVSFRHDATIHDKMIAAVDMFSEAHMTVEKLQAKLERLSDRVVTRPVMVNMLDRLFPYKDEKQRESKNRQNKIDDFLALFENNDDNTFPEIRGTAYNFVNAATEYIDHYGKVVRTEERAGLTDNEIRAQHAMFGAGAELKANLLDMVLEETAMAPLKTRGAKRVMVTDSDRAAVSYAGDTGDHAALLDTILSQ
jgi:phage/plasmid-like protein (TIGR03299 family)